jgi:hypothetical protein
LIVHDAAMDKEEEEFVGGEEIASVEEVGRVRIS